MKKLIVPAAALICFANSQVVFAQSMGLPPTNMGKFVHTPGDNQYGNAAQEERHGAPAPPPGSNMGGGGGGGGSYAAAPSWTPAPRPFRPDPSVQAIAADEPVAPSYFPPLPDRLELPVQISLNGGMVGGGGSSGFHSNYQSTSNGFASTGDVHNAPGGYVHEPPGLYIPQGTTRSGYRCLPANETFSSNSGGSSSGGGGSGSSAGSATAAALRGLGREPKLSTDNRNGASQPDAPQPVVVNQSTTQDLSLPEDEFDFRRPNNNSNNFVKRTAGQMGQRVGSMARGMSQQMLNMGGLGMMNSVRMK